MTDAASTAGRDGRGRFQPGQSGNPAGKKPGTLNVRTQFRLMLADGDFEGASRFIIDKSTSNLSAARFVVDHADPKPRGRRIALDVAPDAGLVERYAALTRALIAGEISAQEATTMARLLERDAALQKSAAASAARPPAPSPAPAPHPTPARHSAPRPKATPAAPAPVMPEASRRTAEGRAPDWRGSVSWQALMAESPASDLHVQVARQPHAARPERQADARRSEAR